MLRQAFEEEISHLPTQSRKDRKNSNKAYGSRHKIYLYPQDLLHIYLLVTLSPDDDEAISGQAHLRAHLRAHFLLSPEGLFAFQLLVLFKHHSLS